MYVLSQKLFLHSLLKQCIHDSIDLLCRKAAVSAIMVGAFSSGPSVYDCNVVLSLIDLTFLPLVPFLSRPFISAISWS